jgi:hypothetical protein
MTLAGPAAAEVELDEDALDAPEPDSSTSVMRVTCLGSVTSGPVLDLAEEDALDAAGVAGDGSEMREPRKGHIRG